MKNRIRWSAGASIVLILFCFFTTGGKIPRLIDLLFLMGMTLLVVAGIYTVIMGGFFNLFAKGFRTLFASKPEREYGGFHESPVEEGDEKRAERATTLSREVATIILITGLVLTTLSYLLIFFLQ
jgi:hypothetical protein